MINDSQGPNVQGKLKQRKHGLRVGTGRLGNPFRIRIPSSCTTRCCLILIPCTQSLLYGFIFHWHDSHDEWQPTHRLGCYHHATHVWPFFVLSLLVHSNGSVPRGSCGRLSLTTKFGNLFIELGCYHATHGMTRTFLSLLVCQCCGTVRLLL